MMRLERDMNIFVPVAHRIRINHEKNIKNVYASNRKKKRVRKKKVVLLH